MTHRSMLALSLAFAASRAFEDDLTSAAMRAAATLQPKCLLMMGKMPPLGAQLPLIIRDSDVAVNMPCDFALVAAASAADAARSLAELRPPPASAVAVLRIDCANDTEDVDLKTDMSAKPTALTLVWRCGDRAHVSILDPHPEPAVVPWREGLIQQSRWLPRALMESLMEAKARRTRLRGRALTATVIDFNAPFVFKNGLGEKIGIEVSDFGLLLMVG